jgi:phosphate-selective porin OprO/OprP
VLTAALLAVTSAAQGLFYAEEHKDGRIYVFNVKANWERFLASGETGTGLTRIGVGPNGETVFADNETALELFFFKHGIKEEVPRPAPPIQTIVWRDGKTRITMGSTAYLEMSNRVQVRYTHELPDGAVTLPGTATAGNSKGSFRIRRAKFKLEGWFYKPYLQYETQLNWPDVAGTPPSRFLEDANINWDITKGRQKLMLRFGQFKVPYGRQQLTSSGSQQFVDRSLASDRYALGRETGIALWGKTSDNKLEWRAGMFNGGGRSIAVNDNDKFQYNARLMWQPNGSQPLGTWASGALWSEGAFETVDNRPVFALAANFEHNDMHGATTANDLDNRTFSGDAIFKYRKFMAVAEYFDRQSDPETGATFKDKGYYVQASAFVDRKRQWEVAGRYSRVDPSDLRGGDVRTELGGVLGYFYNRHNLKVQADFRRLDDKAANSGRGTTSHEFRLQTQFIF